MNVTIYTTPTCAYCHMAKQFFDKQGVEYAEKDVAADEGARQEMLDKSGQMGTPVIDMDGTIIVGFDRPTIEENLTKDGDEN